MNSMKATIAATVLAGFAVTGATLTKAEDGPPLLTMKPLHAVSFDVGRKHAVSFFLSEKGQCKLTMVVADAMQGDVSPIDTPVRFDVAINDNDGTSFRKNQHIWAGYDQNQSWWDLGTIGALIFGQ